MLATLSVLFILSSPQRKASIADANAIKHVYVGFIRDFNGKRWKRVGQSMASDFVHQTPAHEKIGKIAFLKERSVSLAPLQHMAFTAKYLAFSTSGAGTQVELSWVMNAGETDKQGKHVVRATGTEAHTWKKSHGKWLLESIQEHQSTTSIDGKVVETIPAVKS